MNKPFHTAVVIGRFQLPHIGHAHLFQQAAAIADNLVILVGSVGQPKTPKNPFSFRTRKKFLENILPDIHCDIFPLMDNRYNNDSWLVDVVNKVQSTMPRGWSDKPPKIALVGHKKDTSSYYLDMFPQWKFVDIDNHEDMSSTDLRENLYSGGFEDIVEHVNYNTGLELLEWRETDEYKNIVEEWEFIESYKSDWEKSPYPPTFVTVDAVVVQSGHVLMIQRKRAPGKGLWALPGGFVEQGESLRESVLRELEEETKIKLQRIVLDRSITKIEVFDHPDRSSRGRTITHAFKFDLKPGELPRIKGGSDAEKAQWLPLNEVLMMGEKIYEDHLDIILDMIN